MAKENLLKQIYADKATQFLKRIERANIVDHGPTIGTLREQAIIDSLAEIIPTFFDISSGFVIDANGSITPQIDVLLYQKGTLSPMLLTKSSIILPIELYRLGIEVKSTITRETFDQVRTQASALTSLVNSGYFPGPTSKDEPTLMSFKKSPPPFLLVSASSDLSQETLLKELHATEGLLGITVFNKCILYKEAVSYVGHSDHDRVIRFWSNIFSHCIDLRPYVTLTPEWEDKIVESIKNRYPSLDVSLPSTRRNILTRLATPSLLPYLYAGNSDDVKPI